MHRKITTMMEARTVSNVHVGLSDVVQEDEFKFTQGDEVAQIKEYGETPTDNEELFATWNNNEPNDWNSNEHHVVFQRDSGNYYLNDVSSSSLARALCEKASPLCHEGTFLFLIQQAFHFSAFFSNGENKKLRYQVSNDTQRDGATDAALFG